MADADPVDMVDRSRYMNPEMPAGYVKPNPELRYKEGIEIDGVHYVLAPYIYEAHIEDRDDYATLSDLVSTSDEEDKNAEAASRSNQSRRHKIKKEKVDDDGVEKRESKHSRKGSSTQAPSSSHSNFSEAESTATGYDSESNVSSCSSQGRAKPCSNTDPPSRIVSLRSGAVRKTSSVTWDRTDVSLSQVTIQTDSTADCVSETSSSSTSGLGSTLLTVTWPPPHSVEGSTPTQTEGTPSFTESSSSGDAALNHPPSKRKGVSSKPHPSATSETEALISYLPKIPSASECTQEEGSSTQAPSSSHSNFSEAEITATGYDSKSNVSVWSSAGRAKPFSSTDLPSRIVSLRSDAVGKTSSVTWDRTDVSLSQVTIQTESTADCVSETSSSSTSGLGSTLHTVTWTPPHSVEGSMPTHTEGTPSFTESSSSSDAD